MEATPFTPQMLQKWAGVSEDGRWGPETDEAVRSKLGHPRDNTGRPWGKKRLVIGAQQAMMYESGINLIVDGLMGPQTRDAMERWLTALKEDGAPKVVPKDLTAWERVMNWWYSETPEADKALRVEPAPIPPRVETSRLIRQDWPHQRDVEAYFGGKGANQTRITLPYEMKLGWEPKTTVKTIVCHKLVAPSILRVLTAVKAHYDPEEIQRLGLDLYGGCLNVRKVRGGNTWSMHSWGIALDFDPDRNQFRWKSDKARLAKPDAKPFWEMWEAEGWTSLGRLADYDWMHVQAAKIR